MNGTAKGTEFFFMASVFALRGFGSTTSTDLRKQFASSLRTEGLSLILLKWRDLLDRICDFVPPRGSTPSEFKWSFSIELCMIAICF